MKFVLIFSIASFLFKCCLFWLEFDNTDKLTYSWMAYLLAIILTISLGFRSERLKVKETTTFLQDFKIGLRHAAFFTLLMTVFVFSYYQFIDTENLDQRVMEHVEAARELDLSSVPAQHPYANMTIDEVVDNEREKAEAMFSQKSIIPATMLGLLVASLLYSAFIIIMFRKVPILALEFNQQGP